MTNDQYRDLCLRSGLKFLVKAAGASALFGDHIKGCFRQIAVRMVFLLGIQLPGPLHHTVTQLGSLIGPLSMLNVGFIMAEENLLDVFKGRKIWLVTILRLIILPMIMIFCVRLTGITFRFPQTKSVLLISLLAAAAPTASSIAQFAEIADNDAVPAGKINILSTLCCIITMTVVITIYQVLC